MLGLVFVKDISDTFAARRAELATRLSDPQDEFSTATPTRKTLPHYTEVNVFPN